jgi:hypothetical protein
MSMMKWLVNQYSASRSSSSMPISISVSRESTTVNPRLNHSEELRLSALTSSCPHAYFLCAAHCVLLPRVPRRQRDGTPPTCTQPTPIWWH